MTSDDAVLGVPKHLTAVVSLFFHATKDIEELDGRIRIIAPLARGPSNLKPQGEARPIKSVLKFSFVSAQYSFTSAQYPSQCFESASHERPPFLVIVMFGTVRC